MARAFMVAFLGRAGSGALMHDLGHHPKTLIHMEIFGEPNLPGDLRQTDANRAAFLHRMWAGYRSPDLMPPELKGFARGFTLQFKRAAPQFERLGLLARTLKANGAVVIALRREDSLRQVVSGFRAGKLAEISRVERGLDDYHIKPESGPKARAFAQEPMRIHPQAIAEALDELAINKHRMERFLARYPAAVEVTYEEYLADRLDVLNRILAALELEPFAEAPPQILQKVTDDDLSKSVSNYDELRALAESRGLRA